MIPSGPVLALDSSTSGGSVAVAVDGGVVAERVLPSAAGASSLLMPAVDEALRAAELRPRDLAAVVVAAGPGSFTGLRIAAATAKAIVRALGVPLYAYSGLLATAAAHRREGRAVCALFDARNREVFAGCWAFAQDDVHELLAPTIMTVDEAVARLRGESPLLAGDGAALHVAELEAAFGPGSVPPPADESPAAGLLWLARTVP
ncbi:MAG TPA: tRNA (adenosine(37)-N6)-threonylcarbamoyltransferase complex dimerization subunit type 1 TsaB, partial [Longimicrobium sp.]|nr:tRNA (adenosine(37)-N6)-threonylcarbamoyltransferase complex dimerization subunit type 1 TsaB [Longimicrobium sp.]